MQPFGAVSLQMGHKLAYGSGSIGGRIVIALEHPLESPLRPLVIFRIARA